MGTIILYENDSETDITHTHLMDTEIQAVKLYRNLDKVVRFKLHLNFLNNPIEDKEIQANFRIDSTSSIGYHEDIFILS